MSETSTTGKPIGYYVSDVEDKETIEGIAAKYGDRLESLSRGQKYALITDIANGIWNRPNTEYGITPAFLEDSIEELSTDSLLALLIATAEQLRGK